MEDVDTVGWWATNSQVHNTRDMIGLPCVETRVTKCVVHTDS